MVKVFYFARLREALGTASEEIALSSSVTTVAQLRALLTARGGIWREALAPTTRVRVAVNRAMASDDTRIADGDEVAFFPPVTGG